MTLHQAIEIAKAKAAGNAKWTRAIERAAAGLHSGDICVTLFCDDTALVTTPNNSHLVNGRCDCTASTFGHKECVHRAAKRLVEMIEETAHAAERQSDKPRATAATSRAPRVTRNVQRDHAGNRFAVVRCEGWMI